jgi:hypothetical protein
MTSINSKETLAIDVKAKYLPVKPQSSQPP